MPCVRPGRHRPFPLRKITTYYVVFPVCPGCPPGFLLGWFGSSSKGAFLFSLFLRISPDDGFDEVLL
jgi:hypothetical protein